MMVFEAYATGKRDRDTHLLVRGTRGEARAALTAHKGPGHMLRIKEGDGWCSFQVSARKETKTGPLVDFPDIAL